MPDSTEPILEKRGFFWWHGERTPRGRYAPPFGVPGILTVQADGRVRVNLAGSLSRSNPPDGASPDPARLDGSPDAFKGRTIAGTVDGNSRCVYLKNPVYRPLSPMVDGKPGEQFDSDFCIVGNTSTVRNAKSLRFSKLSISLAGLEQWIWNEVISASREKANGPAHSRDVSYAAAETEYKLDDGRISLRTDVHCSAWGEMPHREIAFRQYDWLDWHRAKTGTPEAMRQEFVHIEEFLAILTGTYYSLDWPLISLKIGSKDETYTLYFWRNMERSRTPEISNLWTTFPQIRDTFGTLYSNWRKKRREYGPGFYLYLAALRNTPMYIEHRFVNLIWGIESLHRGMNQEPAMSKNQQKVEDILRKAGHLLNSGERSWLKSQRRIRMEPPLEYRITSTFAGLPWKLTKASLHEFALRCRIRRNNISHYGGPEDKSESYETFRRELMELTEGLTPLYHAALLQEIGLDAKTVASCGRMPIGFRIRQGLELARLKAAGIEAPPPVDMEPILKLQRKYLQKWRRRQTSKH